MAAWTLRPCALVAAGLEYLLAGARVVAGRMGWGLLAGGLVLALSPFGGFLLLGDEPLPLGEPANHLGPSPGVDYSVS